MRTDHGNASTNRSNGGAETRNCWGFSRSINDEVIVAYGILRPHCDTNLAGCGSCRNAGRQSGRCRGGNDRSRAIELDRIAAWGCAEPLAFDRHGRAYGTMRRHECKIFS